ncbi:cupin domain-containing protein [Streptomyces sp. SHP 1-2]|uniref:cupin domain-containing protein n=1 Tax=Streptomyces sp. SHP 1-2 TaxID=2769489 RepID=UPI00223753EA|nr:cupin domain-containing protein [Streptomyces sp. SHP 1-2]MCW5253011.1 cupin domain-containing protein [Streptomyces sp. SHP 1-2]
MSKPALEFFPVTDTGWTPVPGSRCEGLDERILAQDGEIATRILRFAPGTDTTPNGEQSHDFWEEVYILSGSIHDLGIGKTFTAGMYACRPPGMKHGPWISPDGCMTFEARYTRGDASARGRSQ